MDFDKLAYPEKLTISGIEYKGQRNMSKGQVLIPYTDEPDVGIGDVITQKSGKREIHLKVVDVSFLEGGSLGVGTSHPHMLTLKVENTTAQPHVTKHGDSTFNIGSISGENVQVGNSNTLTTNVTIQELAEKIAKSDDPEAKSKLKEFLQNSTVGSLIGAGASALIGIL
ncbi:hypothetical protein I6M49_14555 [Shewanella algae]|uniref:hypothetical protein n=1 Tax=Alteromonadales TaxID=135622 RepID=UPI001AAD870B|nr:MULTISPECIES: hypothetical protein [Alteromonadales]MBO2654671.1 hypothetical protein [Shewanella algae]MCF2861041.1 hypothetical protein [Pseudoalteromonas sp. CNAT2-18]MCG7556910.1 hypothetical protein [Pseudoalteromonas sp. CNAT2-18.1]